MSDLKHTILQVTLWLLFVICSIIVISETGLKQAVFATGSAITAFISIKYIKDE